VRRGGFEQNWALILVLLRAQTALKLAVLPFMFTLLLVHLLYLLSCWHEIITNDSDIWPVGHTVFALICHL